MSNKKGMLPKTLNSLDLAWSIHWGELRYVAMVSSQHKLVISREDFLFQMNNILDPQGFLRGQVRCHGTQLSIANRTYQLNTEPFTYTLPHHPTLLLDPGHVGGKYDDLRKMITNRGDVIQEGVLTLKTAQYLQELLQKKHESTNFIPGSVPIFLRKCIKG